MTLELLKFWVVKPTKTADTNLCTNPSFETGTTGWTTGGTNTITKSETVAYRGVYSCKCTYTDNDLLASYAITLTDVDHTASMDIYIPTGYTGTELTLTWTGFTSATIIAGKPNMTIKDKWQRVHCHINPDAGDLSGTLTLSETGTNGDATEFIYIDGVQIEARNEPTTYFDGDTDEYTYWNGQQYLSTSVRKATSRRGGTLVDLESCMHIGSIIGLGINPYMINKTQTAGGRSLYQRTNKLDREFLMIGEIIANNYDELQTKRKTLQELFQPDLVTGEQDVTLRYMATTAAGLQASEVVEIRCRMKSDGLIGHWSKPTQEPITLMFEAYDDLMREGNAAVQLDYNNTLANADYIVKRDRNGVWSAMAGTGLIYAIAQHPITKEIYIAGAFEDAGGDSDADYLAKWDETTQDWVSVVAGINGSVVALVFDSSGNLYIGGGFTNLGDANGDRIAKIDTAGSISSLGTGLPNGSVSSLILDNLGNLYVGGSFTSAGGVANTGYIAMWNGSIWVSVAGGFASGNISTFCFNSDFSKLYIGGSFVNHTDENGDKITVYDVATTSYSSLGLGADGTVLTIFIKNNIVYIGGEFLNIGGLSISRIAKWTGNKYESLGDNPNGKIESIVSYNENIVVGGQFTQIGQITISDRLAEYLGNGIYKPLDLNLPGTPFVEALLVDNLDNLYVSFTTTGNAETAGDDIVTNSGTAITYPIITVTGPGLLRQIVNTTTGKGLYFNNLTLLSGEVITMDLRPGRISMTSTFRGSVLGYVLPGSSYDFPLMPGSNRIATFIDGTTDSNTTATMQWVENYHGIDGAQYA